MENVYSQSRPPILLFTVFLKNPLKFLLLFCCGWYFTSPLIFNKIYVQGFRKGNFMAVKIQAVCGYGCGSSLMLRMAIDEVLKKNGLEADTFCGDVNTCLANPCDVIFISRDLGERIIDRATMPVIIVDNFMSKKEVEDKVLAYFDSIK